MLSLLVLPSISFSCRHTIQGIIYLSECLFLFLRGDILISDRNGITHFLPGDGLGVLPYLLKLFGYFRYTGIYGLDPDERITVGVRLYLRPVGTGYIRLLRKRLRVLWSGVSVPVSHMKRMSLRQISSMRRLE